MQENYVIIIACLGVAMFITLLCIMLLLDDKKRKKSYDYDPNDWMFKNFNIKMYDLLFHSESNPELDQEKADRIGKKVGMNMAKYYEYCYVAGDSGNIKNIIMNRVYGFALMFLAIPILPFQHLISVILILCGYFLTYYMQQNLKSSAMKKKTLIESQLPRFVDLLKPALKLQFPIDTAIKMTARGIDCEFSMELLTIMEKTNMSSSSWSVAFEEMAKKYQVDILNDFVTNIVTAFNNGVDIYETVERQSQSIKKTHRTNLLNRAQKLDTAILAPITIFKLLPIIVLVAYPALMQSMNLLG